MIGVATLRETCHRARITIDKQRIDLGTFGSRVEAGRVYDFAVRERGLQRKTNFPLNEHLKLTDDAKLSARNALAASCDGRSTGAARAPIVAASSRAPSFESVADEFEKASNAGPLYVCTQCLPTYLV